MKTNIIYSKDLSILKSYDFLIKLSEGDIVFFEGIEYSVNDICLDIDSNVLQIFIVL